VELAGKQGVCTINSATLGCGRQPSTLNGTPLPFDREANPYRHRCVEVSMATLSERLTDAANTLHVQLG